MERQDSITSSNIYDKDDSTCKKSHSVLQIVRVQYIIRKD